MTFTRSHFLIALAVMLASVFFMSTSQDEQQAKSPIASTFSSAPAGTRALYLATSHLRPGDTHRWRRPLKALREMPIGTLVVIAPERPLSYLDHEALERWLERGGRLVYASEDEWTIEEDRSGETTSEELSLDLESFGDSEQIMLLDTPSLLRNEGLADLDSVTLGYLHWMMDHPGPIYFDEYHHGFGDQLTASGLLRACVGSYWGLFFAQLSVGIVLWILAVRLPLGRRQRPLPAALKDRSGFGTLIASRAGLFRAARASQLCAEAEEAYLNNTVDLRNS